MKDTLVLCYHAVSGEWPADIAVTPDAFEDQLTHLLSAGYTGATFTEAITAPPASRTVAVTFDDGFRSVLELAFPILDRLGLAATLFVPTAKIGAGAPMSWPGIDRWLETPYRDELMGLSWDEIGTLAGAGWEIGSHTRTHPHLPELDDRILAQELVGSREEIEQRLQRPCPSIAYPYGHVDDRVSGAAARAGYRVGAALPVRLPRRGQAMTWPRIMVSRSESGDAFRRHVSVPFRRLRASPAWAPISKAVQAVRAAQRRLKS